MTNQSAEEISDELAIVNGLLNAYELLTPGGSEFHNDPIACFDWIQNRLKFTPARLLAAEAKVERMQKVVLSARPLFKFLENAGIYRDLTLPDLAVRPYNDLMTRLEEALAELEAVE